MQSCRRGFGGRPIMSHQINCGFIGSGSSALRTSDLEKFCTGWIQQYDQQFIVYNSKNKIGWLCGLDDIDTINKRAEVWRLAFRGNTETIEAMTKLEDYCINNLQLKSIYACVKSTNRASQLFWEKYGYDERKLYLHAKVSQHNPKYADIYTYTKQLSK